MYCVYCHTNKINNKKYIGITSQKPEERWGTNGNKYYSTPHFYSAIQKYGWDNFTHEILYDNLTKEEACVLEKQLIKEYDTQNRNKGYNILEGGETPSLPQEIRQKMSKAMMGNANGAGHPCSEEKKQKIRAAQLGREFTPEHRQKLSEAAQKRHVSCSKEKRDKLRKSYPNQKPVYCEELNIVFPSVQECARQLNIPATNISKLCNGRGKTLNGYHLRYADAEK